MSATYTLTPAEFAATEAKVEKINARAAKRGFTGRIALVGCERVVETTNTVNGRTESRVWVDVIVDGEAPSYGGWTFLAAVDTVGENAETGAPSFVLRYAPGVTGSAADRDGLVAGRCEHCGTERANRRYTYLVRNDETGQTRQVGSTCIQDFTGWQGRPVFVAEGDIESDLDEAAERSYSALAPLVPAEILAAAFAAVRAFGWIAASAGFGLPTAARVQDWFHGTDKAARETREAMAPFIDEGARKAAEVIEVLHAEFGQGRSDYERNLITAISASYVTPRQVPLVASAVSAYDRVMGKIAQRKATPDRSAIEFLGQVKDKVEMTGRVTYAREHDGDYGVRMLVKIENATTVAKIWTAAAWAFDVEVDTEVTVRGTVKRHEMFNGTRETELTRVKRVEA